MKTRYFPIMVLLMISTYSLSSQSTLPKKVNEDIKLNTYLIERNIPDAGKLTAEQLQGISKKSCDVLDEMGPNIKWMHSYVTEDKVYCLYKAENEDLIREHAQRGGFPVNNITVISNVIDPKTASSKKD